MMMGFGVGHGFGWMMGAGGLLLMAIVVGLLVRVGGMAGRDRVRASLPPTPQEELKFRLARGEITPDDYEELRAHLRD